MGLMGIQLRIASKASLPIEFELKDGQASPPQAQEAANATQEAAPIEQGEQQNG
jgi:hypothetical protein